MLRSPLVRVREHLGEALLVVGIVAAVMVVPATLVFGAVSIREFTAEWTDNLRSVVYLHGDREDGEAERLAEELRQWEGVATVEVRAPAEAYRQTRTRIGDTEADRLGLVAEMFPFSLVVEGHSTFPVDASLLAKLSSLETRQAVESVDVPGTTVESLSRWTWRGLGVIAVLLVLFGALAVHRLKVFLIRLEGDDHRERRLMERFGARQSSLRRVVLWRGVALGLWAGVVAFVSLIVVGLGWQSLETALFGSTDVGWRWFVTAVPLVVGPLLGLCVAWWVVRRRGGTNEKHAEMALEPLLEYEESAAS